MSINKMQIQDEHGNTYHPETSASIVMYDDGTDVKTKTDSLDNSKIDKIVGNAGQLLTIERDGSSRIKTNYILQKAKIVDSAEELEKEKLIEVDFAEVFNNWYRFSHNNTTNQPANEAETQNWNYDASTNRVICTVNSATHIGFVSKEKYDNYIHEVTLSSTDTDDDAICVVIAFAIDENGIEHTLSVCRRRDSFPYFFIQYDYAKSTSWRIAFKNRLNNDDINGETANTAPTRWNNVPNGTRVKIERNGDIIKVYASAFNATTIDESSLMTIDLSSDPRLSIFRGACAYGYSCWSQNASTFSDIKFVGGYDDTIFDIQNNVVYSKVNNVWVKDASKNIIEEIGIGRFVFNENTGKLFYINGPDDVILLSETNSTKARSEEYIRASEINTYIDSYLKDKNLI